MRWYLAIAVLTGMTAAAALAGCGRIETSSQPPPAAADWAAGIPAPASLALHRAAVATQTLPGSQYDTLALPPQRTAPVGADDAQFSPQWLDAEQSGGADLAYALYVFAWDDADTGAALELSWQALPPAGACWIGLMDYERQCWDWRPNPEDGWLAMGARFLGGHLAGAPQAVVPVLVVAIGTAPQVLDQLTLHTYNPAQLTLTNPPLEGDGTAQSPYVWDNARTMQLSVYDVDGAAEAAASPQTVWELKPAGAGQFDDLAQLEVCHLSGGFTGSFSVGAFYLGLPTQPARLYCIAVDGGASENLTPVAALSASPQAGQSPLEVSLDGRDSYDPDGLLSIFRWDFEGDGVFDDVSNSRSVTHMYYEGGAFEATLEVEDADGATSRAYAAINVTGVPPQWHFVQVRAKAPDSCYEVGRYNSLCRIDGRPAIAFTQIDGSGGGSERSLYYVSAADPLGETWNPPLLLEAAAGETVQYFYLQLKAIAGRPAVAFCPNPRYLRADDAAGSAWSGTPAIVDSEVGIHSWHLQLLEVGGLPGMLYHDYLHQELQWTRATDADGTAFAPRQVLDAQEGHSERETVGAPCNLALIDGRPAAAYRITPMLTADGNAVCYVRAADALGDAWNAPVLVHQTPDTNMATGNDPALLELKDGQAGVFYQDYVISGPLYQAVYYFVHGPADGSSFGGEIPVIEDTANSNYLTLGSPMLVGGAPALACIWENSFPVFEWTVMYAGAQDATGESWHAQQELRQVGASHNLSACGMGVMPALSFYDQAEDALYFAAYY